MQYFYSENAQDLCRKLAESDLNLMKVYINLLLTGKKWKEAESLIESSNINPEEFPLCLKKSMKCAIRSFLFDNLRISNLLSLTADNIIGSAALCEAVYEFAPDEVWAHKMCSYIISSNSHVLTYIKPEILSKISRYPNTYTQIPDKYGPNNENHATMPDVPVYMIEEEQHLSILNWDHTEVAALDTEWRTPLGKFQHTPTAILQIGLPEVVYIIDLIKLHTSPELDSKLFQLFGSSKVIKIGIGFDSDLIKLQESYKNMLCFKETVFSYVDLITVHKKETKYNPGGLANLSEIHIDTPMCKAEQKSNWEQRPLSISQIHYAALDVYMCLAIYNKYKEQNIFLKKYSIDLGSLHVEKDSVNYQNYPSCENCKSKLHLKDDCYCLIICKICGSYQHDSNNCPCFF